MSFIKKNPRLAGVFQASEKTTSNTPRTGFPGLTPSLTGASALLASSGIPDLDVCLGAGLPAASLLTVFEDFPSSKANYTWSGIVRCFLAEGVATAANDWTRKDGGWIAIVGHDISGLLTSLPRPESSRAKEDGTVLAKSTATKSTDNNSTSNDMKIAWRYEGLKEFDSNVKRSVSALTSTEKTIGHTFDLGRKLDGLPKQMSSDNRALSLDLAQIQENDNNCDYRRVWKFFIDALERNQRSGLGRIVIGSLGAPGYWNNCNCAAPCGAAWLARAISNRIQEIEATQPCIVLLTIPTGYLIENHSIIPCLNRNPSQSTNVSLPTWISAVENVSDAVIELKPLTSFTHPKIPSKPNASSTLEREYDGFFVIRKALRRCNSFKPAIPDTMNLAFKIKRRRFVIEKFHLPPSLEEENTQATGSLCSKPAGGTSSHPLDF